METTGKTAGKTKSRVTMINERQKNGKYMYVSKEGEEWQDAIKSPLDMAYEFRIAMNQPVDVPKIILEYKEYLSKAWRLIEEEYHEMKVEASKEMGPWDHELLKEIADLIYVLAGYCALRGWNLDEAMCRIHESNMSKLDDNGVPIKDEHGKVMKGPNYKKADLSDLV